jgi:FkbM family methyltransferase
MHAEVYGQKMFLDPADTVITPCLLAGRTFERMTVLSLSYLVKPGDRVVDVGANIGYFTLLLARLVGPAGQVFAFEPDARAFKLLRRNVEANGYKNVVLVNKAVGRQPGQARLYLNHANRGDNRLMPTGDWLSVEVEMTTLDAAVEGNVGFIKIDVQGYEEEVLAGAGRLLALPSVALAVEVWPEGLHQAGASLDGLLGTLADFTLFYPDEGEHAITAISPDDVKARAAVEAVNVLATKDKSLQGITMPNFQFFHGLGDCANAAHLFALYKKMGHELKVQCSPDKTPIFEAAGQQVVGSAPHSHPWDHAPAPGHPTMTDHYSGNKTAFNISRGGLPNIGSYADRWDDLCAVKLDLERFVTPEVREKVSAYLGALPRPVVLIHSKGNTGAADKNYPDDLTLDLYRQLLDRTDGSLLLCDWDNRVPRLAHGRVRHLADDWQTLDVLELYETIRQADLLLGVDSGVLHFSRFTDTPAVGIWTRHYPSHYALPKKEHVHVVSRKYAAWNRRRRPAFNLIESAGDIPTPEVIAETAAFILGPRRYLADPGPDAVLAMLLKNARAVNQGHHPYCDRHRTFDVFLSALKRKANPVVVETGCIRSEEDWGAGFSSYVFGLFLKHHGGELHSVDLDANNVSFARTWTTGLPVTVHQSDSRPWLGNYQGTIDALYLDSADVDTPQYQEICLEEARLALPKLAPDAPILIDDSPWKAGKFGGKGGLAVPWLLDQGFKVRLAGYQVLLTRGDDQGVKPTIPTPQPDQPTADEWGKLLDAYKLLKAKA